jgi:hypothetical protein
VKKAGKDVQTFGLSYQVNVGEQMMLDIIAFVNNH